MMNPIEQSLIYQTQQSSPNLALLRSPSSLVIRPAMESDIPDLWDLVKKYASTHIADDEQFTLENPIYVLERSNVTVIDFEGEAVGVVWFTESRQDWHALIHFLIRPQYFKQALKQRLLPDLVDYLFDNYPYQKFKLSLSVDRQRLSRY